MDETLCMKIVVLGDVAVGKTRLGVLPCVKLYITPNLSPTSAAVGIVRGRTTQASSAADVGESFLLRFITHDFKTKRPASVGCDYKSKTMIISGKRVKLEIWDTAGQERFHSVISKAYRQLSAAILMYNVEELRSYEKLEYWFKELDLRVDNPKVVKMIVGNQTDREVRVVTSAMGRQLAQANGALYGEASAKTGDGVDEAFKELVKEVLKTGFYTTVENDNEKIRLQDTENSENNFWQKCFLNLC